MNPSFTREEKLFVLAEMIKASRVDIDSLVRFIKSNDIEPDWMSMQLPLGRNMNQCIQAAEHLSLPAPPMKRKYTNDDYHDYRPPKRLAYAEVPEQAPPAQSSNHVPPAPSTAAPHVPILPRPANGLHASQNPQPAPALPKKRGRPSRADKARRDLRPLLPQHLAPRPSAAPTTPLLTPSAPLPRPILPAVASPHDARRPVVDSRAWSPPVTYSTSPRMADAAVKKGPEQSSQVDTARPRVLAEKALDGFERTSPLRTSEHSPSPKIEPDAAASVSSAGSLREPRTTLHALLEKRPSSSPANQEATVPISHPA